MNRPTEFVEWTDGTSSYVAEPTPGVKTTGFTAGNSPPFKYWNWLVWLLDQWVQYLDQQDSQEAIKRVTAGESMLPPYTTYMATSGSFSLALPVAATYPGYCVTVINTQVGGAGITTITKDSGDTIQGVNGNATVNAGESLTLISDGVNGYWQKV